MNHKPAPDEVRQIIFRILGNIAPEADLHALKPDVGFRDQLDIDSMDFLNFVIGLHDALQIEIPETDYPKLSTINGCVDYVSAVTGTPSQAKRS